MCARMHWCTPPPKTHTLTQESKYRDAIRFYQPLIARNTNKLLGVTAIVLANLCVSYIMTSQVRCLQQCGTALVQQLSQRHWLSEALVTVFDQLSDGLGGADSLGVKAVVLPDSCVPIPACHQHGAHWCAVLCCAVPTAERGG